MLLAGRSLDALTAVSWGLATKCVDASELEPSALSLASSLVGSATQMLGPTKQLLTAGTLEGYAAHLAAERASISAIVANPDTRARVSAFARRSS
jgi:enoyl-CoA hydratase/carnithine racemase